MNQDPWFEVRFVFNHPDLELRKKALDILKLPIVDFLKIALLQLLISVWEDENLSSPVPDE